MTAAAIKAVYVDYKRVKSRKVHQIIFEVPTETWPENYRVLGEPDINTSQWFGIAALNVSESAPTPKDNGSNLAANAALLLRNPLFQRFLESEYGMTTISAEASNITVKHILKIDSKSVLNQDPQKAAQWRDLRAEFEAWKVAA